MKKLILASMLLLTQPAFALLSPLDQSVKELKDIINSEEIAKSFPNSEKIISIDAIKGGYLIRTREYEMWIEVRYQPQGRPGPAVYELIFHEPTKY